ncbi:MAG: two pore domain potassium channel family protein, partial [Polyangiaceae bacterium]|nr:two pore domain potassium channel family protein [Polyangiaceae bacterium]
MLAVDPSRRSLVARNPVGIDVFEADTGRQLTALCSARLPRATRQREVGDATAEPRRSCGRGRERRAPRHLRARQPRFGVTWPYMRRSLRRLLLLLGSTPILIICFAWLYMLGMTHLEHDPRDFSSSLSWAAETFTTTGYGGDHHWRHPLMVGFVILVQFAGVFLVFLVFPIFLMPFLEERFEGRLPTSLPNLERHVVIYRYGPAVETFVRHLEHQGVPFVIYEENEAAARRLRERGRRVVFGHLADDDPDLTSLHRARGLIANGEDHDNAVLTL